MVRGEVVAVYPSRVGVAASTDIWSCLEHMCPQSAPLTERRSRTTLAEQPIIPLPRTAVLGSFCLPLGLNGALAQLSEPSQAPSAPWSSQWRRAGFRSRRGTGTPSSSSAHPSPHFSWSGSCCSSWSLPCSATASQPSVLLLALSPSLLSTDTHAACSCPPFSPAHLALQIAACSGCQLTKTSCEMRAP